MNMDALKGMGAHSTLLEHDYQTDFFTANKLKSGDKGSSGEDKGDYVDVRLAFSS